MPLARGTSRKTLQKNIREFHTGETYARTRKKYGKRKADRQAIAAAYAARRTSRRS